jgi:AbrB family looped-hinge helix DNA binding protein
MRGTSEPPKGNPLPEERGGGQVLLNRDDELFSWRAYLLVYEVVLMDSKGRVLIPAKIRSLLNIREGMKFMVVGDVERNEIKLIPLVESTSLVYKVRIIMRDEIGALSSVINVIARNKIDLLLTHSRTIRRGDTAEWIAIVDFSQATKSVEEVVEEIRSLKQVVDVEIKKME